MGFNSKEKTKAEDFIALKSRVKEEVGRRSIESKSVGSLSAYNTDYSDAPDKKEKLKTTHLNEILSPLNAIINRFVLVNKGNKAKAISNLDTIITAHSQVLETATNSDCDSSCSGLCETGCYSSCSSACGNSSGTAICGGSCASGCDGGNCSDRCGGSCSNSCDESDCWGRCDGGANDKEDSGDDGGNDGGDDNTCTTCGGNACGPDPCSGWCYFDCQGNNCTDECKGGVYDNPDMGGGSPNPY